MKRIIIDQIYFNNEQAMNLKELGAWTETISNVIDTLGIEDLDEDEFIDEDEEFDDEGI